MSPQPLYPNIVWQNTKRRTFTITYTDLHKMLLLEKFGAAGTIAHIEADNDMRCVKVVYEEDI